VAYDPETDTYTIRVSGQIARTCQDWSEPVRFRFLLDGDECDMMFTRLYDDSLESSVVA
jgi:hypothetical protein